MIRIVLLSVVVSSCAVAGSNEDFTNSIGTETESPIPSSSITAQPEQLWLREDFLAVVYPIDHSDLMTAARVYEAPLYSGRLMAPCLADSGYESLAESFEEVVPAFVDDVWLFPNIDRLNVVAERARADVPPESPPPPWVLLNWVTRGQAQAGIEGIRAELESNPQWGTDPAKAEELFGVLSTCQTAGNMQDPEPLQQAQLLRQEWMATLRQLESPELEMARTEAMKCLRNVDEMFQDVATPNEWWGVAGSHLDGLLANSDTDQPNQGLALITGGYVACMEPLLEVRKPVWLNHRLATVEQNFTQLDELQSTLHQLLDDQ